jgi:hypothetical protein
MGAWKHVTGAVPMSIIAKKMSVDFRDRKSRLRKPWT